MLLERMLGRRNLWRAGRFLYMRARADFPNHPATNGERHLQEELVRAHAAGRRGLVALDIGANVGEWTMALLDLAARQGLDGLEVHAFEPVPETFMTLRENLASHARFDQVRLHRAAMSRQDGTVEMFVEPGRSRTSSIHAPGGPAPGCRVQVPAVTIDRQMAELGLDRVDFVKCDAEGHDVEVLLGAEQALRAGTISALQFEYNHRWISARRFLKDAFDLVEGLPYSVGKVTPRRVELYERWHPELERFFESNYVLLHREAIARFSTASGRFDAYNTYRE